MSLDVSGRRLLVGSQDGSLRMWNFNNGQCLKEFLGFGKEEITCVACLEEGRSRFVAAAGWHGKVCIWPDGPKETEIVERSMKGHSDDISCMTLCAPNSIATGGYDGKVIVWKLDGTVRCKFLLPLSKDGKPKAMNHLLQLPQDRILVGSVSDGEIYFWRVFDARTIYVLTSGHHDEPGPACTDANNEILFSSDARGYIKAWDLSVCNFKSEDCSISNLSEMLHFRAHHERIVAMEFMEKERILLTTSLFGTCRLWTDKGTRIGQFGQLEAWDLRAPQTWSSRRPSYISPSSQEEGATPDSSRVSSSTGTSRSSSSRGSRLSLVEKITIPEAVETKEKTDTEKSIEEKAASILEAGAPNFRLESWFAPLQAAYHRQLPIKKIVPWGPIFPANFEHVEKPPPESVTDKSVSVRPGRKKKHMDPMRLSLPNIQFNMPKEKLATLTGRKSVRSLRSTTRSVSTARSISTNKSR